MKWFFWGAAPLLAWLYVHGRCHPRPLCSIPFTPLSQPI
jgi:hypothetical protein